MRETANIWDFRTRDKEDPSYSDTATIRRPTRDASHCNLAQSKIYLDVHQRF